MAVINPNRHRASIAGFLLALSAGTYGAVLPEERADLMYHRYDGGGMVIDGPSVLVRKNIADKISVSGNYYVDKVSSASIDVQTIKQGASKYSEERTEWSADVSYLQEDTIINIGYTDSSENDYEAESFRFDVSHSFFGDMTTINAGYSQGNDDITSSDSESLQETLERRHYRLGLAQVLTKNLLVNLNLETIVDEGYLQNPYRKILVVKVLNATAFDTAYDLANELYPRTRNSDAFSIKASYYLPWDAAIKGRAGYFTDSWGIKGFSGELDYSHEFSERFLMDFRIRHYSQNNADFYRNTFNAPDEKNFLGRDKELSTYTSTSLGVGGRYRIPVNSRFLESVTLNAQYEHMWFKYDDFREVTTSTISRYGAGNEPFYEFDAYALRLFVTVAY